VHGRRLLVPDPIRLGLIGCGHWGGNYAATIPSIDDAILAWCADTSETARARVLGLHPHARVTADLRDLVAADDCDAVIVAAPPSRHAEIAHIVLAAKKHVLVEKPLATTAAAARALAIEARDAGVVAMSGHVYLFHPVVREISRRIRSGETGPIRFMGASRMFTRLASSDERPDVDALWDLAPNDLAMFVEFAGAVPERVFCARSAFFRPDLADAAFAMLEFPGKVIAELRVSWDYPFRERLVTVIGALETLRFDDDADDKLVRYSGPPIDLAGRRPEPLRFERSAALREQIRDFVASVRTGEPTRAPFEVGVDIVRILEALSESAAAGEPVYLTSSRPRMRRF
jgi:predicted dehydrogenase